LSNVRVRFAPSPTGALHIGGARTALFNWLFARKTKGQFILRLEDTDTLRSTQESVGTILEGLKWLGLDWDEGPDIGGPYSPYRQSERLDIYNKFTRQLIAQNKAYYCFCSADEIEQEKLLAQQKKREYRYSGKCKELSPAQIKEKIAQGLKPVIRLKVPATGSTVVSDLIRGEIVFANELLDDFIIVKSNGWPTYNFAVVIDDGTMGITHVIRAEEHLSNTPKQIMLYNALNWPHPQFAHVSMILSPDRSKLSKRHGATSVQEFSDKGYLPETLVNYLALLGWSPGTDEEYWNLENLITAFDLDHVSRSPAVYDLEKLTWMNGYYLSRADTSRLVELLESKAMARGWLNDDNLKYFTKIIALLQSRVKTLDDILESAVYFFEDVSSYDHKGIDKFFNTPLAIKILQQVKEVVNNISPYSEAEIEKGIRAAAAKMGVKAADLIHPTRLALTGRTNSPGLFEVMELIGREKCIERLDKAINFIENNL